MGFVGFGQGHHGIGAQGHPPDPIWGHPHSKAARFPFRVSLVSGLQVLDLKIGLRPQRPTRKIQGLRSMAVTPFLSAALRLYFVKIIMNSIY